MSLLSVPGCFYVLIRIGSASGGCLWKSTVVSWPVLCYLWPSPVVLVLLLLQVGVKKEYG